MNPMPAEPPPLPAARARRLLRRSLLLAAPEWKSLALGLVCLVVASAMNLAFPQALRMLVDGALTKGARGAIDTAALAMFVVGVRSEERRVGKECRL